MNPTTDEALSDPPFFSVVIPTYNRASLLDRAVRSVLAQTYGDFELVIVDDNSSDGTSEMVADYDDPRIVYHKRPKNGGHAAVRNDGIRIAQGRLVAFLDDDDEFIPSFLDAAHALWKDAAEDVGFSWTGVRWVADTADGERVLHDDVWAPSYRDKEHAYLSFLKSRRVGTGHGLIVRRSCFADIGEFDATLRVTIDTEFLVRIIRHYSFLVVPGVHVKVHDHGSGYRMRKNASGKALTYEAIIDKHADTLRNHTELASALHYKTAWLHYHSGDKTAGRSHMLRALRLSPTNVKAYIAMFVFEAFGSRGPAVHAWLSEVLDRRERTLTE